MGDRVVELEPLMDGDAVAALLGVSRKWVYQAAQDGTIPSFRFGRFVRFRESEIRAWIEAQRQEHAS